MAPMICISRVTIALVILSATDQPGPVILAGFTKNGLPLYLRLVYQPFGEAMLYGVAQFYEEAAGWTERHPRRAFRRILTPRDKISGLTEQMLFLKECSNA